MQLDIFEHSADVMLRNDVVHALERRDIAAARATCERLAREFPADAALTALRALLECLEGTGGGPFARHVDLQEARRGVDAAQPLAGRIFGPEAAIKWCAFLWRDLAVRAGALPFLADSTQEHAAPLWLLAGDWKAAEQAVAAIESWRRIPAPLAWMTEARLRMLGLQATWPLIVELAWLSPARLDPLLRRSADPLLSALARKFGESFEGEGNAADLAWFPAWVLVERSDLAKHAAAAQASRHTAPERAFRTLVELLGLERQGRQRDIVERRKTLRGLHPSLYAAYMKTR